MPSVQYIRMLVQLFISVASVVELAGSGTSTAEITSSIIKYWYQNNTDEKTNQKTGALLN